MKNDNFEGVFPPNDIPKIWCDFNAFGLSSETGELFYYSLHRVDFYALPPSPGMQIFIWDHSDEYEVIGYVATLEPYPQCVSGWRARAIASTWYSGPPQLIELRS